ncbi:MAG: tyrosine--tRNA ligase [Candidatus Marinimicrobia bacterium]|nr:tyrosine--tRNA ligase [Candidatus Neomarinimicrobiota bacterium]
MLSAEKQLEIISINTDEIILEKELLIKLKDSVKNSIPLNVKLGFDPSRPDLHIGHSVVLNKLKSIQDLGHNIILVVGDFTAMIGDPTGQNKTRPQLSISETKKNAETYINQVSKILNINKTKIVYNSSWLNDISFSKVIELCSKFTISQFLERDDFSKRYKNGKPISIHEFMYPLAQAYDSVFLRSDIELGGTDQKFNLLLARDLQKYYEMKKQVAVTMPILEGTDGKDKMSKSYDNYIAFNDTPNDMYGKVMSINDELVFKYFSLLTKVNNKEIEDFKLNLKSNKLHPKDLKRKLSREIVSIYYDDEAASRAEINFDKIFVNKSIPDNIPEFKVTGEIKIIDCIYKANLITSRSEIKRLIKQGAVRVNDEQILDLNFIVEAKKHNVIKVGKRKFLKIV